MLPAPTDPAFPEALKAAREARGLSFKELAHLANISSVMPGRYENRQHSCFATPSFKTWEVLNDILCPQKMDGCLPEHRQKDTNNNKSTSLKEASIEALIAELKARGARSVDIRF